MTRAVPCIQRRLVARSGQRWGSHPAVRILAPTVEWFTPDYRSQFGVTPTSLAAAVSYDGPGTGCPARREDVGYWIGTDRGPTTGEPSIGFASGTRAVAWPKAGPSFVLT